jgi:hypothetical protein
MRRHVVRVAAFAVVALAVSARLAGQTASTVVQGTVVTASGAPASGFFVAVLPVDQSTWPEGERAGVRRAPVDAGRFLVADLPPARYSLVFATEAMLAGWPSVSTLATLNRRSPFPLDLRSGGFASIRAVVDVTASDVVAIGFALSRVETVPVGPQRPMPPNIGGRALGAPPGIPARTAPGAISGRVTDADGHPVAGVEVRAMREVTSNDRTMLALFGQPAMTDVDGRYRLENRGAGEYLVAAAAAIADLRAGATTMTAALRPSVDVSGQRVANANTYFGDVSDRRRARFVTVAASEVTGIDIQLLRHPVFAVTGTVAGLALRSPREVFVTLTDADDPQNPLSLRRTPLLPDGTFSISGVPNGHYAVSVSTTNGWAADHVRIADREPEPLVMTLSRPTRVRGRVEFRGTTPAPTDINSVSTYGVELAPATLTPGASVTRVSLRQDLSFDVPGAGPGPFQLRGVAPSPWIQVAGIVDGVDTLDIPLAAAADAREGVIVFSDHPSALRVEVPDADNRRTTGTIAIVFSDDARYWSVRSRRVQRCELAAGSCTLTSLPPGRYFVAAMEALPRGFVPDAEQLASLKDLAVVIDLAPSERRSVQVRVR